MRVEVTQEDIEKGQPRSIKFCPIALALGRVSGLSVIVAVRYALVGNQLLHLPDSAMEFQGAFDNGSDVTPFSFEAEIA